MMEYASVRVRFNEVSPKSASDRIYGAYKQISLHAYHSCLKQTGNDSPATMALSAPA